MEPQCGPTARYILMVMRQDCRVQYLPFSLTSTQNYCTCCVKLSRSTEYKKIQVPKRVYKSGL